MKRDVHFDSDTYARVVRLTASGGPASDHIEIDDARFLFSAHFKKSGPDLILTGDDGRKLVLVDYFNTTKHPDLTSHGATLSGDLVAHLAGPDAPGHYAQAGAPAGAEVIGKCERMGGGATVQHANGVVEELKAGDAILKGDVVMTSDGSSAVLSLMDGTVFNMGASARMVLNELTYDSNSNSNSALISLVKGSFTFVAGQVAHTGDMKVDTPVATMGIRGTTVNTNIDADINGNVYSVTYSLMTDPNGNVGAFQVLDRVTGVVIANVTSTGSMLNVTPAANFQVLAQETAKSPAQVQQELAAAQILFPVYQAVQAQVAQPTAPGQGPQGPQPQQQQNTSSPGAGSISPPIQQPQPSQETGSNNDPNNNANPNKVTIISITTQVSNLPTSSNDSLPQQTLLNPITTVQSSTHQLPTIAVVGTPADLVEPFGGNGILPTATVGFAVGGDGTVHYDANALASDGWTTSDGFTFIKHVPYGTAVLDPPPNDPSAGHLAFILDPTNPDVRALRLGHQISVSFTIPVIDDLGDTAQTTVTFTIDGTNHPVAQTGAVEGKEDATSITGQAQASEFGFALTFALIGPNGEPEQTIRTAHGTVTMHSDGTYVYTPDHGFFGSDSFAFRASDGELTTDATTVTVTVDPVAPIAQDDTISGAEDSGPIHGQAHASEINSDPLTYALVGAAGEAEQTVKTAHGTVTMHADGSYSYTPDHGYFGADSFTYTASDATNGTTSNPATITVNVAAAPPVAQDGTASGNEDDAAITGQAVATEVNGDVLTYALVGADGEAEQTVKTAHGTVTMQSNGSYSYTPDAGFVGTDQFTFLASDGSLDSNTATVTVTVNPVAPTVTAGSTLSVSEDRTVPLAISETPFDVHDVVSITITGVPSDATLSAGVHNEDGSWTLTPGQQSGLTLTAGEVTQSTLTVTATNTAGVTASSSTSIALTVNPVAPTLSASSTLSVNEDGTVPLVISETPADARDTVSIKITGVPSDAILSAGVHNEDGSWTLTPAQLSGLTLTAGQATQATLTVTATNTEGATASASANTVLTVNPVLTVGVSVVDNLPVQEGQTLVATASILGDNADAGATINYQWQSSSDGGQTWTNVGGAVSGNFNGAPSSFLQLTEADENLQLRVQNSFTDSLGQVITATSSATVPVADVTPVITAPISQSAIVVDDLSITKNETLIYNNTFSQAPPASPTILSNGVPTPIVFLTLGSSWTEANGHAVLWSPTAQSTGFARTTTASGNDEVYALLNTNTDPTSTLGLKESTGFAVSSTFNLTALQHGSYGMQLNDGTSTHGPDEVVQLLVTSNNGTTVVELLQSDLATNPVSSVVLASQTLTSDQLTGNNQIEFQLSHAQNAMTVTGSFELLNNGTVTTTVSFTTPGTVFTSSNDWTRVAIGAFTSPSVALNVQAGQSPHEGQTLTASAETNDSDATIHYQWESSADNGQTWTPIAGAADSNT